MGQELAPTLDNSKPYGHTKKRLPSSISWVCNVDLYLHQGVRCRHFFKSERSTNVTVCLTKSIITIITRPESTLVMNLLPRPPCQTWATHHRQQRLPHSCCRSSTQPKASMRRAENTIPNIAHYCAVPNHSWSTRDNRRIKRALTQEHHGQAFGE